MSGPDPELVGRPSGSMSRTELRRRALSGVMVVFSRGIVLAAIGLAGQLFLTRLLSPADFGALAVGLAGVAAVNLFCDGGLGAGLIRRENAPTLPELRALSALQVTLATVLAVFTAALALPFGHVGWVTAVVVSSAPLLVLQIPGRIMLERDLLYGRLAKVEIGQVLAFNLWAVTTVLLGAGVWGLATAPVARAVVGLVAMTSASPVGTPFPRYSWSRIRGLMQFGVRFQMVTALWFVQSQGLNIAIAALSGPTTLGLVSLARRLIQIPFLLLQALWRVSFPTMSQLVARGEAIGDLLERVVRVCATGLGVVLVALAASAPGLIPGLFGDVWAPTAIVLPAACLGLALSGAVSVACQGYLFAIDDASAVIRAGVLQTVALFGVTLPLLPVMGVRAVGLGWLTSYVVEALVLGHYASRRAGARLLRPLIVPTTAAVLAGAAGWLLTRSMGPTLLAGVCGGTLGVVLFVGLLLVFGLSTLKETVAFARSCLRAARESTDAAASPSATGPEVV
jgi:O-antigen/teichoic acid export membrane protein